MTKDELIEKINKIPNGPFVTVHYLHRKDDGNGNENRYDEYDTAVLICNDILNDEDKEEYPYNLSKVW